jgi:N-dimethylarginine dimethylaminohydrolase
MATKFQVLLGLLLGLAASAGILSVYDRGAGPAQSNGPLLSENDGALRELVMHYTVEAAETVLPTYRDFLSRLPADVTVHVVCQDKPAYDDLRARVGPTECRLAPLIVDHPITTWSRDRWLALGAVKGQTAVLLHPRGEDAAEVWPARAGDQQVAADLAAAMGPNVSSRGSDLYFDGGDFTADSETVFVCPAVLFRNLQRTVESREKLLADLSTLLKRRVVLLEKAPDHHAAMYMLPIGEHRVLVGDPRMASRLLAESSSKASLQAYLPGGPDFSEATAARFDAVARQCQEAGYTVIRIPVAPGVDGRTYVTYVNAILDYRDGRRIVYMPVFRAAEVLNRAAAAVWTAAGYEVRPVACDACGLNFGTLHCLVNVLRRE